MATLSEQVVGSERGSEFSFAERATEVGIPDEFVFVHRLVLITTARLHAQRCVDLNVEGQCVGGCDAVVILPDRIVLAGVGAYIAQNASPDGFTVEIEREFAMVVSELQAIAQAMVLHGGKAVPCRNTYDSGKVFGA